MIKNLNEYFKPEIGIFLDAINYKRKDESIKESKDSVSLLCQDNITISLEGENVRIIVTRSVSLKPNEIFNLTVSFGADLRFNERRAEYDWEKINLAEEFVENGEFITTQLVSRIALIIGEITSSYGQQPLMLPPVLAKKNN